MTGTKISISSGAPKTYDEIRFSELEFTEVGSVTTENKFLFATTLYNLDTKGKVRQWSVSVVEHPDTTATITVAQGLHEGKLTERDTHITKGKNVGRANETTPAQQAVMEAESKVALQIQKFGYQAGEPRDRPGLNGLNLLQPMAALERGKAKGIPDDEIVEFTPKLDGFRLMTDGATMYTREGCLYENKAISEQLSKLIDEGFLDLDGELYCHSLTFQEISSAAKKTNANSHLLKFYVYDYPDRDTKVPFSERRQVKNDLAEVIDRLALDRICVVDSVEAPLSHWDRLHSEWVSQGYEGSIVRRMSDVYLPGGRDKRMLKRKDFHDEEFKITGIDRSPKPAPVVGSAGDYPVGSVNSEGYANQAQFICETEDGKEFAATMEGGVLARAKLWAAEDSAFIGKLATVKYFEMTDDGIPRHPIARRRLEL